MKNKNINPIMLQSIKETNYKSILYIIEERIKISRTEISNITSLSPATVTNACEKLLKQGLIREISRGFSLSGRKPIFLEINPDAGEIIGVVIYKNIVRVVISTLKCEIISSNSQTLEDGLKLNDVVVNLINDAIRDNNPKNVMGIGVALEWTYDFPTRQSRPRYNMTEELLEKGLADNFKYPVVIENYSNLCLLAESFFYYAGIYSNLLYVNFDESLSAGIIVNNTIPKNRIGNIGEIGHLNFQYGGPGCACGRNGCVHSFCSTSSLVQKAIHGIVTSQSKILTDICGNNLNNVDENTIMLAIEQGDSFSIKIVLDFINYLLVFLDTLYQLYFPQVIILGGRINIFKSFITKAFQERTSFSNNELLKKAIIDFSHFNEISAVKGACKAAVLNSLSKLDLEGKDE